MSEIWCESLRTLARQFESNSTVNPGLYCMIVEVSEERRDKLSGPPPSFWMKDSEEVAFRAAGFTGPDIRPLTREEREACSAGREVPGLLRIGDKKDGELLGIRIPMTLRSTHFWGNREVYDRFLSLSADTWHCLLGAPGTARAMLPRELAEPSLAKTRDLGNAIVVMPTLGPPEPSECWLRTLFHLAWQAPHGLPLRSSKRIWEGSASYPYDEAQAGFFRDIPGHQVPEPLDFFYSIMGDEAHPQDISLASSFAISLIVSGAEVHKGAAEDRYDVFLAYNSQDKPAVMRICDQLRRRKLKPWIDSEQVPPGSSFQRAIQRVLSTVRSAAVFIGPTGLGRWQELEVRTLISQSIERAVPVIPVLLPGTAVFPPELLFLRELNWVQFGNTTDDIDALDRLEWGITGRRPDDEHP